ncbi:hypothetical protein H696_04699 [Fonticula alba]|uniref:Acyl-coenzyme A oxidase n=1 Tax=Fonticula alba TaxID=691883 RepID=A0A058Z2A8_FONAL|nr:hypothetical protein H696_04699 [Fonticula alba]KCV68404.1 hypothetical protein H696_04699 [Fonticula alba]|eukprot:XP_009496836.1 hypothetical protein H696_04699 [Fonticula alba]
MTVSKTAEAHTPGTQLPEVVRAPVPNGSRVRANDQALRLQTEALSAMLKVSPSYGTDPREDMHAARRRGRFRSADLTLYMDGMRAELWRRSRPPMAGHLGTVARPLTGVPFDPAAALGPETGMLARVAPSGPADAGDLEAGSRFLADLLPASEHRRRLRRVVMADPLIRAFLKSRFRLEHLAEAGLPGGRRDMVDLHFLIQRRLMSVVRAYGFCTLEDASYARLLLGSSSSVQMHMLLFLETCGLLCAPAERERLLAGLRADDEQERARLAAEYRLLAAVAGTRHTASLPAGPGPGARSPALPGAATLGELREAQTSMGGLLRALRKAGMPRVAGALAQTELGHGTAVRGMETTAIFDRQSGEFILHTPTATATKWWPGGLGSTATHCILVARLFAPGAEAPPAGADRRLPDVGLVDRGPQLFLVHFRDPVTRRPLPGFRVGDLGPKAGLNDTDNGYMALDNVRVPHGALLPTSGQVDPSTGAFGRRGNSARLEALAMTLARSGLIALSTFHLSKAVTIAVRFSTVRRQTAHGPGRRENAIADYPLQRQVLAETMATAYALFMGSVESRLMAEQWVGQQFGGRPGMEPGPGADGDPEQQTVRLGHLVHVNSCLLKSAGTRLALEGVRVCQRHCGGHGFADYSGLTRLSQEASAALVFEGDNVVLDLQAARFLVQEVGRVAQGGRSVVDYLHIDARSLRQTLAEADEGRMFARLPAPGAPVTEAALRADVKRGKHQVAAMGWMCHRQTLRLAHVVRDHLLAGMGFSEALSKAGIFGVAAARGHANYLLLGTMQRAIEALLERYAALGVPAVDTGKEASLWVMAQRLCRLRDIFYCHWPQHDRAPAAQLDSRDLGESAAWTEALQVENTLAWGALLAEAPIALATLAEDVAPDLLTLADAWDYSDEELGSCIGRFDGDIYRAMHYFATGTVAGRTKL